MENSTFKTPDSKKNGCSNFSDFEAWWSFWDLQNLQHILDVIMKFVKC